MPCMCHTKVSIQLNHSTMRKIFPALVAVILFTLQAEAQVSTVEFGKNRVQYKKFNWQYLQTRNFNAYYSD